jgi:hypothetical protein
MKKIHNKVINLYLNFEQKFIFIETMNYLMLKRKKRI